MFTLGPLPHQANPLELLRRAPLIGIVQGDICARSRPRPSLGASDNAHAVGEGKEFEISQFDQSSGTLAWITLAVPALRAFQNGDVLLVDELDVSLHPYLASTLVEMFKSPDINISGAQLVFTTHDVAFMSLSFPASLRPDEIWFTEKKSDGATDLYSLAEYPTRRTDNFSKRYLDGRYGAVPLIDLDVLAGVLSKGNG